MSEHIIHTSDDAFEQDVLQSQLPVLVDYWAEWCGPCRVQGPILDKLAEKYASNTKLKITKLNVDDNPQTQSEYHVMSIPTMIFYKNGQIAETFVGLRSEGDIEARIQELLEE